MGLKEELFEKYQKLGDGGKLAVGLGTGAIGGGLKGTLGAAASFTRPVNKFLASSANKSNKLQSHYTKVFSDAYYRITR